MRSLVALLLIASVLHTQLAVGCHCQHAFDAESHSADAEDHCFWHGDAVGGHVHYLHHHGDGATSDGHEHSLPPHAPCDNCPECAAADPVGLRMEVSSDLDAAVQLAVWVAPPVELLSTTVGRSRYQQAAPPDGVRSLFACGTLLRI